MSYDDFDTRKKAEVENLKNLKNIFFLFILIEITSLLVQLIIIFSGVIGEVFTQSIQTQEDVLVGYLFYGVVYGLEAVFTLYFARVLINTAEALETIIPGVNILRYGGLAYLIYAILIQPLMIFGNLIFVFLGFLHTVIYIIAIITAFIAKILIAIGVWRIGVNYRASGLKVGAILMIILGFIGTLAVYLAMDEAIKKVNMRIPPPPPPPWLGEGL